MLKFAFTQADELHLTTTSSSKVNVEHSVSSAIHTAVRAVNTARETVNVKFVTEYC